MSFIDSYQKSWALRYIREAKAELTAAQSIPYMASSLILEGIRKAQAAVYYSLGDPASAELIVHEALENKHVVNDPVLKFLVEMEQAVQMVAMTPESERDRALKEAVELVQVASEIVNLFTGEKTD
jgi:hypothetical protein